MRDLEQKIHVLMNSMKQKQVKIREEEEYKPLTDQELDLMLPTTGYIVLDQPSSSAELERSISFEDDEIYRLLRDR